MKSHAKALVERIREWWLGLGNEGRAEWVLARKERCDRLGKALMQRTRAQRVVQRQVRWEELYEGVLPKAMETIES